MRFVFAGSPCWNDPLVLYSCVASLALRVVARLPDGRPVGCRVGEGGGYTVSAQIEPRQIQAGGSVSVVAKLEGTGNLPYKLLTPEQNGVEWLEPTLVDRGGPKKDVVQGL